MKNAPQVLWSLTALPAANVDSAGIHLTHLPLIDIIPTPGALDPELLRNCRSAIVTSRSAVLALKNDLAAANHLAWYAIGEATAAELALVGASDITVAPNATSRDMLPWLTTQQLPGPIFFPHGNLGGNQIINFVRQSGQRLYSPVVYQTIKRSPETVAAAMPPNQTFVAIVLGSPSAVQVWAAIPASLTDGVPIASLGPTTSQACHKAGLSVWIESPGGDVEQLLQMLKDELASLV